MGVACLGQLRQQLSAKVWYVGLSQPSIFMIGQNAGSKSHTPVCVCVCVCVCVRERERELFNDLY